MAFGPQITLIPLLNPFISASVLTTLDKAKKVVSNVLLGSVRHTVKLPIQVKISAYLSGLALMTWICCRVSDCCHQR